MFLISFAIIVVYFNEEMHKHTVIFNCPSNACIIELIEISLKI
jgi:hypothetical protein